MARSFEWLNPPPVWRGDARTLEIETAHGSDFWRETLHGFVRDDGHAWLSRVEGDFSASVRFTGEYETLYDQAGLMLRVDERTWIKTGIEYTDGLMHFSVVVTAPRSDWSVIPLFETEADTPVAARISRHGDAVRIDYALADGPWRMARLTSFPAGPAQVGIAACSPKRGGFRARFEGLEIGPAIASDPHDD